MPLLKSKALKDAMKPLRKGDWEAARCGFAAAAAANPDDQAAIFGHGVFLEANGHFDLAEKQYEAAAAIKAKKPIEKAQKRLTKRVVEVNGMVGTYGLTWKIPDEPPACN